MKIVVYHSPDAPPSHAYLARLQVSKGFVPIQATGATHEEAQAKMQAHWDDHAAKAAARTVAGRPAPQAPEQRMIEKIGALDPIDKTPTTDTPLARFFYHPESDSLMKTMDGSHPGEKGGDGALVEEITFEQYIDIEAKRQAETPASVEADLDDLLG